MDACTAPLASAQPEVAFGTSLFNDPDHFPESMLERALEFLGCCEEWDVVCRAAYDHFALP